MGIGYLNNIGYRDSLNFLIVAFCRDYSSRKKAIEEKNLSRRTLMEYEYINSRLADAAREIVGEDFEHYITEIGESIGYGRSRVPEIGEGEYKMRKQEVNINIAKKLHLID